MRSVLFVCMGNICRSPAAEGVFRKLVADAGRADEFDIDSAGTISYHSGDRADRRMRAAAEERGYRLESIARRVRPEDFERFELIVAMDDANFDDLQPRARHGSARLVRMCAYSSQSGILEVPDPYYGGDAGFQIVLDILEDACANLLRREFAHGRP